MWKILRTLPVIGAAVLLLPTAVGTKRSQEEVTNPVANGPHLWYEVQSDAENPANVIVCGTRWDAETNGPVGFVYASIDGGKTWRRALEDRRTAWVTEHSCTFGSKHRAYFISEASKVIDGWTHHELGSTRLFMSTDGGQHWRSTLETGWADYSTSAVSSSSGRLYTFFQSGWNSRIDGTNKGNNLGLLLFSSDGKQVSGPFVNPFMQELSYRGVYPSNAVSVRSGAVVALFYAKRKAPHGQVVDLGMIRGGSSEKPSIEYTIIAHPTVDSTGECSNFFDGSLAYDGKRNKLLVVYTDGCGDAKHLLLVSSEDEGRTWTESVVLEDAPAGADITRPSIVVKSDGNLGLMWAAGAFSGRWFYSTVRGNKLRRPAIELSKGDTYNAISSDSLWTWIYEPGQPTTEEGLVSGNPSITVTVRNLRNSIWRESGLTAFHDEILAVWPTSDLHGIQLSSRIIKNVEDVVQSKAVAASGTRFVDVTGGTLVLYCGHQTCQDCGGQLFDEQTSTLKVYVVLANRRREAIKAPIKLLVRDLSSRIGDISILNSTNGLSGAGAEIDISGSVTGDQIAPGTTTNPFLLSFALAKPIGKDSSGRGQDLVSLTVSVLAGAE